MPAYKDKEKGTWYASFYYEDWTGKKVKKLKRGFSIKRDALEWERTFLQQQTADLEMTFENFVALYAADMKGRIKENTWGIKEHILAFNLHFARPYSSKIETISPSKILFIFLTAQKLPHIEQVSSFSGFDDSR